ncbi:MAG: hypothetical protein R6V05_09640 [Candidatus Brocadiia bacterium]
MRNKGILWLVGVGIASAVGFFLGRCVVEWPTEASLSTVAVVLRDSLWYLGLPSVLAFVLGLYIRRILGVFTWDVVEFRAAPLDEGGRGCKLADAARVKCTVNALFHNTKERPIPVIRPRLRLLGDSGEERWSNLLYKRMKPGSDSKTGHQVLNVPGGESIHVHWTRTVEDVDAFKEAVVAQVRAQAPAGHTIVVKLGPLREALHEPED